MVRSVWPIAIVLAGCVAAPGPATPTTPSTAGTAPASLAPTATTTMSPLPSAPPLEGLLPAELAGLELHTFAVGQDILERLAERLGTQVARFEVRYASEHGARFFQTYALRLPGADGSTLAEAWTAVAYPPEVTDVTVDEAQVGGRPVTVTHSPSAAARLGTFYAYVLGDILLVVQAMDPEVAAEVLAALP